MYLFWGIFFILCFSVFLLFYFRRKKIIQKINGMDTCQKIKSLNKIAEPLGFLYLPTQNILTSRIDAWQREFGYLTLYDQSASHYNMVFDCEPIYFNYRHHTWRIELWKGQYGINIGGEVGVYRADTILSPDQYDQAVFHSVPDNEMLPIYFKIYQKGGRLFAVKHRHWWLTGFRMGYYCEPEDLVMDVSISCPDYDMLSQLQESLLGSGYNQCDFMVCDLTLSFSFSIPHTRQPRNDHCLSVRFARWQNRLFCRIYQWITRPFSCTPDQLLYLYYFLPSAFRHMLCFRRNRKQKKPAPLRSVRIPVRNRMHG